jgi:YD repeat-containing protein
MGCLVGVRSLRWGLAVSLAGALAAWSVVLLVGSFSSADQPTAGGDAAPAALPSPSRALPPLGTEVITDRTEQSKTFERPDGSFITRVYPEPVHYADGGTWRAIDNELVAAGPDYVHRTANDGDAKIPRSLDDPFVVSKGGASVRLEMVGGQGQAQVAGDTARFADAGDGVSAAYQAVNDGLKETLTLASADAQRTFSYDLTASSGLSARTTSDGGVELVDGDGKVRFGLGAPVMWDAASDPAMTHATDLGLTKTTSGWRVTLAVNEAWLQDSARQFPVTVDPDVYWTGDGELRHHGAVQDCTLASGSGSTSLCADPRLKVGSNSSNTYKSLLSFAVGTAIPQDSTVYDATLALYQPGTANQASSALSVREVTSGWTNGATWTTRDGSTAWTTPGGDAGTIVGPATSVGNQGYWYYLGVPAEMVTGWVRGTHSNNGLQLSAAAGSPQVTYSFVSTDGASNQWPALDVYWEEDGGDRPGYYTQDTQRLDDHSQLAVNVANGNLIYTTRDMTVAGQDGDLDIAVDRLWQSVESNDYASFGRGWYQNFEQTNLRENNDGSVLVRDQTGAAYRFTPAASGTFTAPPGYDATLCLVQDTGTACPRDGVADVKYRLTDNQTGQRFYYYNTGLLRAIRDGAGHQLTYTISGHTATITGAGNRHVTLTDSTANDMATSISDGTSTGSYTQSGPNSDQLATATDPDNKTTSYQYNSNGYLTRITDATGSQTRIEWQSVPDDGSWRATKITRVLDSASPTDPTKNPTTTYAYDPANHTTVVTDPAGNATATVGDHQTTYVYDSDLHVTGIQSSDTSAPVIALSGELYDQRSPATIDEGGEYDLTVSSTDGPLSAGASGVRRVEIEVDGLPQEVDDAWLCFPPAGGATCDKTTPLTLNTAAFEEGTHTVQVTAVDSAGNQAVATFTFTLDFSGGFDFGTPDDGSCTPDDDDPCESPAARAATVTAAAAIPFMWGVADDKGPEKDFSPLNDPLLGTLGVGYVRRTLPFDIAQLAGGANNAQYVSAVNWVRAVFAEGYTPVVTFTSCRQNLKAQTPEYPPPGKPAGYCSKAPSYSDYKGAINAWFAADDGDPATKELRDVPFLSTWNESNLGLKTTNEPGDVISGGQPLAYVNTSSGAASASNSGAFLAGQFARYLYGMCDTKPARRCTAVASEFLDSAFSRPTGQLTNLGKQYLSEFRKGMGRVPMAWGWHAYKDGVEAPSLSAKPTQRWRRLRSFVNATVPTSGDPAPPILLMEQGPRWFNGGTDLHMNGTVAARIIDCYTHSAIHASSRINGFFYYQITGASDFDTGLRDFRSAKASDPASNPPTAAVFGKPRAEPLAAFQGHSDANRSCR